MSRANFTENGLVIGQNDTNMTYLYGISDFFTMMFQDTDTLNLLLQAGAQGASEIYSRFLQLTSSISLTGIQETINSAIKLVVLPSTSVVAGQVNVYTLPENITTSRYIANLPLLPSTLLEQDVDYRLEVQTDGSVNIRFATNINTLGFATQVPADGVGSSYALWFVDAAVDERLISKMYGNLIGIDPANSTDAFYNLVYGLFYVYVNGPTLDLLIKGLNLVLGIPLARANETVLSIRQYLTTDQSIVITNENQYLIPYGLSPIVGVGDTLNVGDELAQWVQIQDYINNGEWWINLQIPSTVIPNLPAGQKDRYATEGSHFDYLMRTYLKTHTFLVNVNVAQFQNIQSFTQLSDIINKAKPTYTQPIYVWSIATLEETITLTDDLMIYELGIGRCENIEYPIDKMHRDNTDAPLMRGCPTFIRSNVPMWVTKIAGTDPYLNGTGESMNGIPVNGFIDSYNQFRTPTEAEAEWLKTLFQRNHDQYRSSRSKVGFTRNRNLTYLNETGGQPVSWYDVPAGMRVIPLYITMQYDVAAKCLAVGADVPSLAQWTFTIFDPADNSEAINELAINDASNAAVTQALIDNFNTLFFRGTSVGYLGAIIPPLGMSSTYAPLITDVTTSDYLLGVRIIENSVGIYWVTSNQTVNAPPYFPVAAMDQATITYNMPITRNHSGTGTPFYNLRGRGTINYNSTGRGTGIDGHAINDDSDDDTTTLDTTYSDAYNTNVTIDRSGVYLVHAQELK
jgi:hypothetical protein